MKEQMKFSRHHKLISRTYAVVLVSGVTAVLASFVNSAYCLSTSVLESEEVTQESIETLTFEETQFANECGQTYGESVSSTVMSASLGDVVTEVLCSYFTFYAHVGCITGCTASFPDDPTWPKNKRFRENMKRNVCIGICRHRVHSHFPACPVPVEAAQAE